VAPVRLTSPLVRDSGVLRPATWDEAIDRAAAALRHTLKAKDLAVERLVVQDFLTSSAQLADVVLPASAWRGLLPELARRAGPGWSPSTVDTALAALPHP
jgi:predicted molibdopterin-dependent oxidoreductase YjgC